MLLARDASHARHGTKDSKRGVNGKFMRKPIFTSGGLSETVSRASIAGGIGRNVKNLIFGSPNSRSKRFEVLVMSLRWVESGRRKHGARTLLLPPLRTVP